MDGVEARYRTTAHPDFTGPFSCAGFVKAYYEAVHGVFVDNLMEMGPPRGRYLSEGNVMTRDMFVQVDVPQKGDLIFFPRPPHRNNHSAIVKFFDGRLITLIEQNFKWAQNNGTYTWLNRTIPYTLHNNDYQIWRLAYVPELPFYASPYIPDSNMPETPALPFPSPAADEPSFVDDNPVIYEIVFGGETVPAFYEEPVYYEPPPEPEPVFTHEVIITIDSPVITVNDVPMLIDAPPYIENNRTMLPVRYVSYALGLAPQDLVWDEPSRSVTVFNKGNAIMFAIGSNLLVINQELVFMDCAAVLRNGFAFLPVRYLAEAMGVHFEWDGYAGAVRFLYYFGSQHSQN
jgi:hypothetical protein